MTPKNNKTRLLYNIKFCVSFHIHQWFQLELQSGNTQSGSNWTIFELCDLAIWHMTLNKANLRDLIAATGLVISNWIQIVNFSARVTVKFDGWPKKNNSALLYYVKLCASFQIHWWIQTGVYSPETLISGRHWWYVIPCDLENWWMNLKNNRAPLLCYFNLCASFHTHWWIQTGVTVQKRPIWVKFYDF